MNVPLASLKFGTGGTAQLQSVTIAGNQFGVFFIGQMQLAALNAEPAIIAKPVPADNPDDNTPPGGEPNFPQPGDQPFPQPGGQSPPGRSE